MISVPKELQGVFLEGGAELVVARRAGEKFRRHLFVLSSEDREHRAGKGETVSNLDAQYIARLRDARRILWENETLRKGFLFVEDYHFWSGLETLSFAVGAIVSLSDSGGSSLLDALRLHRQDIRLSGMHSVQETPISDVTLGVFEPLNGNESSMSKRQETPCQMLYHVAVTETVFGVTDALSLPFTEATYRSIGGVLATLNSPLTSWSHIASLQKHQQQNSVRTIADIQAAFPSVGPAVLASLLVESKKKFSCRLRSGLFLTLLHVPAVSVFLPTAGKAFDSTAVTRRLHRKLSALSNSSSTVAASLPEELTVLSPEIALMWCSPLRGLQTEVGVDEVSDELGTLQRFVFGPSNCFFVLYGPKVAQGIAPLDKTVTELREHLLNRARHDDTASHTVRPQTGNMDEAPQSTVTVMQHNARVLQLRHEVSIFLARQPATLAEIVRSMEPKFGKGNSLEVDDLKTVVRDVLRSVSQFTKGKYHRAES